MTFLSPIIPIKDVLTTLYERGVDMPSFQITFISLDKERNKGGEIVMLEAAQVPKSQKVYAQIASNQYIVANVDNAKKNPKHLEHNTINLLVSGTERIVKVHIDLITEFNNKRVVW